MSEEMEPGRRCQCERYREYRPSVNALLTIDVAEAASLALLGVMQPTSPIDGNVTLVSRETSCSFHGSTSRDGTVLEETVKDRTVICDVELGLLSDVILDCIG